VLFEKSGAKVHLFSETQLLTINIFIKKHKKALVFLEYHGTSCNFALNERKKKEKHR